MEAPSQITNRRELVDTDIAFIIGYLIGVLLGTLFFDWILER